MSDFIIPVSETTDSFIEQVDLDGLIYDLQFRWNERDNHWFMDIGRDGVFLIEGIKLVNSPDLLNGLGRIEDLPEGVLSVEDLDGFYSDPDDTNFGDRVQLRYTEAINV